MRRNASVGRLAAWKTTAPTNNPQLPARASPTDTHAMTQTEMLLIEARDIAHRILDSTSDEAVLAVFHRLCTEQDIKEIEGAGEVLH